MNISNKLKPQTQLSPIFYFILFNYFFLGGGKVQSIASAILGHKEKDGVPQLVIYFRLEYSTNQRFQN